MLIGYIPELREGISFGMETIRQGLEKIEKPLRFSAGNAYRNLALVRDLETPLRKSIAELRERVRQRWAPSPESGQVDELLAGLDALVAGLRKVLEVFGA